MLAWLAALRLTHLVYVVMYYVVHVESLDVQGGRSGIRLQTLDVLARACESELASIQ